MSLSELSQWMADHGLRTTQGGIPRKGTLHKLLANPVYCGAIRWGGKLHEGKHKPLISRALFERVQERMRISSRPTRQTSGFFPYRGLLTCGYSGRA